MENEVTERSRTMPLDVLRQPIRIRLIEICTEWERISPSEIVAQGLCADIESMQGKVEGNEIVTYRVDAKVSFVVE